MTSNDLTEHPIHLGLGATAVVEPLFTGEMEWYAGYGERHGSDGNEARLVSMHTFSASWDVWEMHPNGSEVVLCVAGAIELVQELDGAEVTTALAAGEYAINAPAPGIPPTLPTRPPLCSSPPAQAPSTADAPDGWSAGAMVRRPRPEHVGYQRPNTPRSQLIRVAPSMMPQR